MISREKPRRANAGEASGVRPEPGVDSVSASLGAFIRAQRQLANLSLRRMADLSEVSNPYLSQLERGLHEPSVRVLRSIARALHMPPEQLLERMGMVATNGEQPVSADAAIRGDAALTDAQKAALLAVYRSYVTANQARPDAEVDAAGHTRVVSETPSPRPRSPGRAASTTRKAGASAKPRERSSTRTASGTPAKTRAGKPPRALADPTGTTKPNPNPSTAKANPSRAKPATAEPRAAAAGATRSSVRRPAPR